MDAKVALLDQLWDRSMNEDIFYHEPVLQIECDHEINSDQVNRWCVTCGELNPYEPVTVHAPSVNLDLRLPRDTTAKEAYFKKCLANLLGEESISREKHEALRGLAVRESINLRKYTSRKSVSQYLRTLPDGKNALAHLSHFLTLAGAVPTKLSLGERNFLQTDFEYELFQDPKKKAGTSLAYLKLMPIAWPPG